MHTHILLQCVIENLRDILSARVVLKQVSLRLQTRQVNRHDCHHIIYLHDK